MHNNIFDSHAHYDDESFSEDLSSLLSSMPSKGVTGIVNCATDINSCERCVEISGNFSNIYFAAGIHPHEAQDVPDNYIEKLNEFAKKPKCVAIGEIGLDYHYDFSPREIQKDVFEKQLILAKELQLPVIIHDRDAHGDTLEIIKKFPRVKGVMHSYSGSVEMAEELIKLGYMISFSGTLTFKNARKTPDVAAIVPHDRVLIETDAPYLAPTPHRGKINHSGYLEYTNARLSEIWGISAEECAAITEENARRFFSLK